VQYLVDEWYQDGGFLPLGQRHHEHEARREATAASASLEIGGARGQATVPSVAALLWPPEEEEEVEEIPHSETTPTTQRGGRRRSRRRWEEVAEDGEAATAMRYLRRFGRRR
jgi:hypothetical protein